MATFTGDSSNNLLEGGNDEDVLLGKDGDDTLVGGLGNDVLLGGNGTDLARFSGRFSDYSLFSSTLPTAIVGPDGTDYLTSSLELLKFEDASVRLRWQSALVPLTGDIQVNTYIDGAQSSSAVAGLGDGGHVVVWTSESQDGDNLGVFGQRYSIHGALIGPEFQVNSSATGAQLEPVVASLAGGGFVVVWTSELSGAIDVFAQRYDAAGARTGGEFRINTASGGDQYDSALAALADGSFIISWTSESQDGDGQGVYAQRCAADGTFLGGEFRVNTNVAGAQDASAVTALADGGFVVTWTSLHADGQGDIYAQLYALGGTPVGSEFKVNTQTTGAQLDSAVAGLVDGGFVVTWTSVGQDGDSNGVYAQRYAATGEALGSEFRVNTVTVDSQSESAVAALADGGFIVTWSSLGQDGNLRGIYAQVYSSAGIPQGPEFLVNTFVDNVQSGSAVAGLAGDGFVVTWDSYSQDNSELPSFGIFAKRYQLPLAGIEVTGDASDQSLTGSSGSDTLQGNGGKDVIDGGDGVDTARYSENTAAQGVRVTLTGATLSDARVAGVVEDRLRNIENLIGGSGRDTFIGDLRANRLVGNDGNDTLQGRGGKDILDGGKGIDTVSFADKTSTQGVRVTLAGLTLSDARVAGVVEDRLRGIENLIGGAGKDSLTGDKLANTLSGLGGNDRLDGKSGNDSLSGGLGNDILLGGLGNDLLDGGDGVDTASYVEKTAIQSLRITLAGADAVDVLVAGLAEDSLRNVENLIGGAGRDTFVGDERANSLVGGGGNDLLLGGTGKDTLEGGLGIDTAIYTDKTDSQGVSVTLNGNTFAGVRVSGMLEDRVKGIENLMGGDGRDTLIGDLAANRLSGNQGNDLLQGRGGKDELDGGSGNDTASYADKNNTQSVIVTLSGDSWVEVEIAGAVEDSLRNIENITGGAGADTLTGDAQSNILRGGIGADTLMGRGEDDVLYGQAGKDMLEGGFGADWFVFDTALNAVSNVDTITDFQPGTDKLVLDDDIFTRLVGTLTGTALSAGNFVSGTVALDGDDYLVYDAATGALRYDADGNAGGAAIQFATLIVTGSGVPGAADFLVVA